MNQDNHKLKNLMTYEKKSCKAKSIMLSVCLDSAEKHFFCFSCFSVGPVHCL